MAVVERAVYFERGYVPPQRGELAFLYLAYFAFGVKHIDVYPLHAEEAVGHGRTRVAGGGHENVQAVACLAVVKYDSRRAMKRAPTSLKASVGPWKSSSV